MANVKVWRGVSRCHHCFVRIYFHDIFFFRTFAGIPPIIVFGSSKAELTRELDATIVPSGILDPLVTVTLLAIHTFFPIIIPFSFALESSYMSW